MLLGWSPTLVLVLFPLLLPDPALCSDAVRRLSFLNRFIRRDVLDQHVDAPDTCEGFNGDQYFAQRLDHNDPNNTATWQQRYQVNSRYFEAAAGEWPVVFLMVGGEGQISSKWVCNEGYTYMQLAKRHRALVVQLEHRFFGRNASSGLGDLSLPNLRLLTMEQALADTARFVPWFNAQHGLNPARVRWVAFGGSYPGSMAAWLRVKYPQLTVGNIASSAPIWPKVDFWEYSAVMEWAIRNTSEDCARNVDAAFHELVVLMNNETQRVALSDLFRAKFPLTDDPLDIAMFLSSVFGAWQDIIQYTFDYRTDRAYMAEMNVTHACELMTNQGQTLRERLREVFMMAMRRHGDSGPYDFSYKGAIQPYLDTSLESPYAEARAWTWMTCNEFGWYQTTDKEDSMFGQIISIQNYFQQCADIFGKQIGAEYVETQVQNTLRQYGDGCSYEATNVLLTNGGYDPWSALGVRGADCRSAQRLAQDERQLQMAVNTPGAAHCSDMYPKYEGEPPMLEATRERVVAAVGDFLDRAKHQMENGAVAAAATGLALSLAVFASLFFC